MTLVFGVAGSIDGGKQLRGCLERDRHDDVGRHVGRDLLEPVDRIGGKAAQEVADGFLALAFGVLPGDALREVFQKLIATVPGNRSDGFAAGLEAQGGEGGCYFPRGCEIRRGGHVRNSFRYYQRAYRNDQGGFEKSLPASGRLPMPWPVENQDVGCRCFFLVPVEPEDPRAEAF